MKKTLVALAVLAASGASFAQSSVTLSGIVDNYFTSQSSATNGVANPGLTGIGEGGLSSSRYVLSGTEDLGGGLKAMFKLDKRFDSAQNTESAGFGGEAYVALGGGFGSVKMGQIDTAFDNARGVSNGSNVFDSDFTPSLRHGVGYTSRMTNAVRYDSMSFSGFSVAALYGFGENKAANVDATSVASAHLLYASGPLTAALGYQEQNTQNATFTALDSEKFTQLSGAYDFGTASVSGGYTKRAGTASDDTGYNLGVKAPFGAFAVSLGYATMTTTVAATAVETKSSGYGLGATYSLSKRTTAYTGWKTDKSESGGVETAKATIFGLGVRHTF